MNAQIAFYKGPASDISHQISHYVTCGVLSVRDLQPCKYSHTELVIDGICYSSSVRDKGVRSKVIDLNSGKWDVYPVEIDIPYAMAVFQSKQNHDYDWLGAVRWGIPFLKQNPNKSYCFEIVADMMGLHEPSEWTALELKKLITGN